MQISGETYFNGANSICKNIHFENVQIINSSNKYFNVKFNGGTVIQSNNSTFNSCEFGGNTVQIQNSKNVLFSNSKFFLKTASNQIPIVFFEMNCDTIKFYECLFTIPEDNGGTNTDVYDIRSNELESPSLNLNFTNCVFDKTSTGIVVLDFSNTRYLNVQNCLFNGILIDNSSTELNSGSYSSFIGNTFKESGSNLNSVAYSPDEIQPLFVANRGVSHIANFGNRNIHSSSNLLL